MKIGIKVKLYNENFRSQRLKMGYHPMKFLSQMTNIHIGILYAIEGMKIEPSPERAHVLSSILEAPMEYLFPEVSKKITKLIKNKGQEEFYIVKSTSPYLEMDKHLMIEQIANILDELPEREKKILRYRFLEDHTLKETGHTFGISQTRAIQIEHNGIRKIRKKLNSIKEE